MKTGIKRAAVAAALLASVALSGCASIEGSSWWTSSPPATNNDLQTLSPG